MSKIYSFVLIIICSAQFVFSQKDPLVRTGLAKQKAGQHDKAITAFTQSIEKHETEIQEYLKKLEVYEKISKFERAENGIEAPPIDVKLARPYFYRGVSYARQKKSEEAIKDFNLSIKIDSKSADVFYERGNIYWAAGKKYEGCRDLRSANSLGDSTAGELFDNRFCWTEAAANYKKAVSSLNLKQYEKSFEIIQRSIDLSPDSASYLVIRANCYMGLEKIDLAFQDFNKAINALPNNIDALYGRGLAYYKKRAFQNAFDDFNKAIQHDPKLIDGYLYRAYACEGMNKVSSALYDYQQVQRLRPRDPVAFLRSAKLKSDNNDPLGACVDFKKAAALGSAEAADYALSCDKKKKKKKK